MSVRDSFLMVAAVVAGLVLGGCVRGQHADHPVTGAAGGTDSGTTSAAERTITVIPASADLISRAGAGGAVIRKLLAAAQPAIGTPYVWGGTSMTTGIDCSNFTWLLYRSIGVPYEHYIRTQELATVSRTAGFSRVTFADALPGDLLVYGYRDAGGEWHGHVVVLVDRSGRSTGQPGLVLGAHGTPVRAVQLVTFTGFAQGYFKTPNMRLVNVLRPILPPTAN